MRTISIDRRLRGWRPADIGYREKTYRGFQRGKLTIESIRGSKPPVIEIGDCELCDSPDGYGWCGPGGAQPQIVLCASCRGLAQSAEL